MDLHTLSLLLKPTSYQCNLKCEYCFYKRVEEVYSNTCGLMTTDTADALVKNTLGAGASRVSYCWQGGEPTLMGLDFYKNVVDMQNRYRMPMQHIENSLQTNGILLDDSWCEFLRDNSFLVGISLDGPREFHDRYRKDSGENGTFDRVMAGIDTMNSIGVDYNILVLLNDVNVKHPEALYSFFREKNFRWLQFINCFERNIDNGTMLPFSVGGKDVGEFYCALFDIWVDDGFPYVSIRLFEDIMVYLLDGAHLSCSWMDECGSYILVEHNGDCYPCDFFVYSEWKLGNILHDSMDSLLQESQRMKFGRMKSEVHSECRNCRWFSFCHGDCTKFRAGSDGRYTGLSEYCVSWKMLLDHMEPRVSELKKRAANLRQAIAERPLRDNNRNGPCPCGSGKKFKKCCGRGLLV